MLCNQITLQILILMIKLSLRVKRGNL